MDLICQKLFHFYFSSLILSNPKVSINSYVFSVVFAVLFGFVCMCVCLCACKHATNKIHWMAKEWQHNWHVHGTRKTFAEKRTNFCCHKWWKSSFAIIVFARVHHGVQTYLHTVVYQLPQQQPRSHCYAIHRKREKEMRTKTDWTMSKFKLLSNNKQQTNNKQSNKRIKMNSTTTKAVVVVRYTNPSTNDCPGYNFVWHLFQ